MLLQIINQNGISILILLLAETIGCVYLFLTCKTNSRFTGFHWPFREKETRRRAVKLFLTILAITAFIALLFYLYYALTHKENAFLKAMNKDGTRTLILLLAGIIGWYFLYDRTEAARQSADAANKNARITERGLTVERLTRATEQLGNPDLSVRVGGILSLEQIAMGGGEEPKRIIRILASLIHARAIKVPENAKLETEEEFEAYRSKRLDVETAVNAMARIASKLQMQKQFLKQPDETKTYLCNLQDTDLRGLRFVKADLTDFNLTKTDFSGAWLMEANLRYAQSTGAIFRKTQMEDAILVGAKLKESNFVQADITDADLTGAELMGADLTGAELLGVNFTKANLYAINISKALLSGADFSEANLEDANISDTISLSANFSKANLTGANISDAFLSHANFSDAELKQVDFSDADLNNAILEGANITDAVLKNTDLSDAFLHNIEGLTQEQLNEAYYSDGLKPVELPSRLELPPERITKTIEDE